MVHPTKRSIASLGSDKRGSFEASIRNIAVNVYPSNACCNEKRVRVSNVQEFYDSPFRLLTEGVGMIDVRAPIEAKASTLPGAQNLPILNDDERARVGVCYKEHGQEQAIKLGHRLVSGSIKDERVGAWKTFMQENPDASLFCWRGGLRSKLAQQWLCEDGVEVPRVEGGFKALRGLCLEVLEHASQKPALVLSGRTGCAKTVLLNSLKCGIDLEGAARHRGSAFGMWREPQPTPTGFEARLAIQFDHKKDEAFFLLEDESATIGKLGVPLSVRNQMAQSPVVVLDVDFDERVKNIYEEYVLEPTTLGEPEEDTKERLRASLARVKRRLGLERYAQLDKIMLDAFETHKSELHHEWISTLLTDYYDPMYDYGLSKKSDRVLLRGDIDVVKELILSYRPS